MKRRLTRAYDSMTMPDGCANTIERKLTEQMDARKTGIYIQTAAPTPVHHHGWAVGVAAVCLMVVLSVGGTMLFLGMSRAELGQRKETATRFEETEVAPTPEDHYIQVTDLPMEEVEAFAAEVRQNVLDGDWEALAQKVSYPILIYDRQIGNAGGLVGLTIRNKVEESFVHHIEWESCRQMFCNWQGICMADGNIWINEVEGELKITAINDMFGNLYLSQDLYFTKAQDGAVAISDYTGMASEITFPTASGGKQVTQIGTGAPVLWNGDAVQIVNVPASVTVVRENAFADCSALRSVFFQGDAPPEAEDVFKGSENVTVYYESGTGGWGDTWCGRPAMQYEQGHVSLGTVTVNIDAMAAYPALTEILNGEREFFSNEYQSSYTIAEYCEKRSRLEGNEVTAPWFTLVDMDLDSVNELILQLRIEGDAAEDYLVLRYTDSTDGDGFVYAFMEPQQKMTDLRKDGSFWWREAGPGQGESRLMPDPERGSGMVFSGFSVQGESPAAQWHAWPCVRPEVVIQSYEYAGTGQSRMPSTTYYTFEGLAMGTTANDWSQLKENLIRMGMVCLEDEGTVSVFDPDAPGTCLYGTLTNEKGLVQLADVVYYISNEYGEREAEVRDLLSADPQYIAGSHLEELDSHGREVERLKALLEYLS